MRRALEAAGLGGEKQANEGDRVFFILREPGMAPRVGFPTGDMVTSLREWQSVNAKCEIDVVTLHLGEASPGCTWVQSASGVLFSDDVACGRIEFDDDGKQIPKGPTP